MLYIFDGITFLGSRQTWNICSIGSYMGRPHGLCENITKKCKTFSYVDINIGYQFFSEICV